MITKKEQEELDKLLLTFPKEHLVKTLIQLIETGDNSNLIISNAIQQLSVGDLLEHYTTLPKDTDCRCLVCRGSIRSNTTISKSEAIHLFELAFQSRSNRFKWHMYSDITNLTNDHWGTKSTKGTQLVHWGLLETSNQMKQINAPEVDGVKSGSQRLTDYGYTFVQGRIKVPETVYKDQYGNPIGWSNTQIGIYDVRGMGQQLTYSMVQNHYANRK